MQLLLGRRMRMAVGSLKEGQMYWYLEYGLLHATLTGVVGV